MRNVFLLGNGFDLHHKLPTKYFDFMCVAKYLIKNTLVAPLTAGSVLGKCADSENIQQCYSAHKYVFDNLEIELEKALKITSLLQNNMWYDYFVNTLDMDSGWIDFEKEIATVITTLDEIIDPAENTVYLSHHEELQLFILSNFKFFIDIDEYDKIFLGEELEIKKEYLKEYPYGSSIFVADKKKIFEVLNKQLLSFSEALSVYLKCFVENSFCSLQKDDFTNKNRIKVLKNADICVSFNYTSTLERLYLNKTVYHIHGTVNKNNIVLGVNPNKADDSGTDNTSLIKFKKYYQREVRNTDKDYIKWYRNTIIAGTEYRLITIGHSLDETDEDVLSDMFLNAKEIYVIYYDIECRDAYIKNIVKIFGKKRYDDFRKEKNMSLVPFSQMDLFMEEIKPEYIEWQ